MTEEQWGEMAHKIVSVTAGYEETCRLGSLLGHGGAGAVYDLCEWNGGKWVIKVLDPDSPVAEQELESLRLYRGKIRYIPDLMKFHSWTGKLNFNGKTYPCYVMRKGKTLADALNPEKQELWLSDPQEVMRVTAHLVNGICSLKKAGLSHGDIKADNILLCEFRDTFYPMFSDYGTVAAETINVGTIAHHCEKREYASRLEERIAYDLHCLYLVLCQIYKVEDGILPLSLDRNIFKLLRIMRDADKKAFDRLPEIMEFLKENYVTVPVSFYLDAVPQYELAENFPFEKIMQWGEYAILRDKNAEHGGPFDPLLLMKIPEGRFDTVYKILVKHNKLHDFVMPIARYFDKNNNEYVLIHAPDDKNKCCCHDLDGDDERLQDDTAIPYTLELAARELDKKRKIRHILDILTDLKVNIEFTPGDIWHLDGRWKLNLFSAAFLEQAEKDAESCRILWKR